MNPSSFNDNLPCDVVAVETLLVVFVEEVVTNARIPYYILQWVSAGPRVSAVLATSTYFTVN